jgi:hypothetical protein
MSYSKNACVPRKNFQGKNNELLSFSFGEKDRSPYFCTPFDGA